MSLVQLSPAASLSLTHGSLYGHHPGARPVIEVEVAATDSNGQLQGKPVRTSVLVDSGADTTMLDGGLAKTLGIDLADARYPRGQIGGVGQGGVSVVQVSVLMRICDKWHAVPVNFTLNPIGHPQLLGRDGAFDGLVIAFIHGQTAMLAAAA